MTTSLVETTSVEGKQQVFPCWKIPITETNTMSILNISKESDCGWIIEG